MQPPQDYAERVYAGVLGKIIGVYLGRPFEGWSYERIMRELGEVQYYVHDRLNVPLVVTDDDISGTFTFFRALADNGYSRGITAAQIGQTWLNYIIENKTVLWWGGMGNSTEHTAFLRMKSGIGAPASGSIATNGQVVAEQIGAQIFIDGWGMAAPGDPALAAELAKKAGSVSHDGEAIFGAQVVAAIEAQAFVENDIDKLLDTAVALIPEGCLIARMIADIREWHAADDDWRVTRKKIAAEYGYDKYGGNCHIIPNHALIILALLYGAGSFQKSLMIVNTCGWDTDCNSGNVGCILGVMNGLAGLEEGPDWRGPVGDRMLLPTADGGRCITDAVSETIQVVHAGCALASAEFEPPKYGARFSFAFPGSVQGFASEESVESRGVVTVENVEGNSVRGDRSLAIRYTRVAPGRVARVETATFITPETAKMGGYGVLACPTLYPGQLVRARISGDDGNGTDVICRLYLKTFDANDKLAIVYGPERMVGAGDGHEFRWRIEETGSYPIAQIGIEVSSDPRADGTIYLDYLTWDGAPDFAVEVTDGGSMWKRAWISAADHTESNRGETFRLIQDTGTGLLIHGCREWTDYRVTARVRPHMAARAGIAVRLQGQQRCYALQLAGQNRVELVKMMHSETILAKKPFPWTYGTEYTMELQVEGNRLRATVDGRLVFELEDTDRPLVNGAIGLLCEEGRAAFNGIHIGPAE